MLEARVDRLEMALQRLAEAQAETQTELRTLAARVDDLAEAQRRTEQRLEALAARVDDLTVRLEALAARVDTLTAHMSELVVQVSRLAGNVGDLRGRVLELDYREKAHAYFLRILRAIHPVSRTELAAMAEDAEGRALLSLDEHADLLQADLVIGGRRRDGDEECYLVAEVSAVVDARDVERAARRARLLQRIVAVPVVAAVAGERAAADASREAATAGVWLVIDGRAFPPGSPPES
ncbi:MAG: hypothetical protein QN168_13695 [Armatimonadota bacterium]|nr:hypothetical protein [Armatimonadota bacterium]